MRRTLRITGIVVLVLGIGSTVFWFHAKAEVPRLASGNPDESLKTRSPMLHIASRIVGIDIEAPSDDASARAQLFCSRIWRWCIASLCVTAAGMVFLVMSLKRRHNGSQQNAADILGKGRTPCQDAER